MEGTKFNSFAIQSVYDRTGYGFSLYARKNIPGKYSTLLELTNQSLQSLSRNTWDTPLGIGGFKQLRFEVDVPASDTVYVSSYILLYCKSIPVGTCPEIGDYPSVEEGENSYGGCEEGYGGYSYRSCFNGKLGGINNQHCIQLKPENLAYEKSAYNLIIDIPVTIPAPKYENIIDEFYLAETSNLPPGLELNRLTGLSS